MRGETGRSWTICHEKSFQPDAVTSARRTKQSHLADAAANELGGVGFLDLGEQTARRSRVLTVSPVEVVRRGHHRLLEPSLQLVEQRLVLQVDARIGVFVDGSVRAVLEQRFQEQMNKYCDIFAKADTRI